MSINLQDYCGDSHGVGTPFSKGEWSYGTNGHIVIRVPLIAGFREDGPNAEHIFEIAIKASGSETPSIDFAVPELPTLEMNVNDCSDCDGTGLAHDCPSCDCKCDECGGKGTFDVCSDSSVSVQVGGVWFALEYVRMLAALPSLKISKPIRERAWWFAFDGGEGLLMPLKSARETNIVVRI